MINTLMYRQELLGNCLNEVFQEAMRGPSEWSIAERDMMASFVSKASGCES